jgi:hypothetical protein
MGIGYSECPRKGSVYDFAVLDESPELIVMNDLLQESQFANHPFVTHEKVRFFAASPIKVDNIKIGAFCVMDSQPRENLSQKERILLMELADIISSTVSEERNNIMETEKDLAYVTSSVLNIIKHPLKKAIYILPGLHANYNRLLDSYGLSQAPNRRSPFHLKSVAISEIKKTSSELQKEIHTLQELLQISLKSIMRIFKIGNYLQQNVHHHDHYFSPTSSAPPSPMRTKMHVNEGAYGGAYSSHFSVNLPNRVAGSDNNGTIRIIGSDSPMSNNSPGRSKHNSSFFPRTHTFKSHNNNMILWNSDDNFAKLNAIVENYRSHCSVLCSQHEYYFLNKDKIRLFTHSDIILLMLILILNYAKNTDHRCDISIKLNMNGNMEKEFHYIRKYGTVEIDIKFIDLLLDEGPRRTISRQQSNILRTESQETYNDDATHIFAFEKQSSKRSVNTTSYSGSYREVEDADHNMLLTALNLVQWISGEFKVDAIELPQENSGSTTNYLNRLVSHCLIKVPCFEKVLESEYKEQEQALLPNRILLDRKSSSFNTSNGDLDPPAVVPSSILRSFFSTLLTSFRGCLCTGSQMTLTQHGKNYVQKRDFDFSEETRINSRKSSLQKPFHDDEAGFDREISFRLKKAAKANGKNSNKEGRIFPVR